MAEFFEVLHAGQSAKRITGGKQQAFTPCPEHVRFQQSCRFALVKPIGDLQHDRIDAFRRKMICQVGEYLLHPRR